MDEKRAKLRAKIEKLKKHRNQKKHDDIRRTMDCSTPQPIASARSHYQPDSDSSLKGSIDGSRMTDFLATRFDRSNTIFKITIPLLLPYLLL